MSAVSSSDGRELRDKVEGSCGLVALIFHARLSVFAFAQFFDSLGNHTPLFPCTNGETKAERD